MAMKKFLKGYGKSAEFIIGEHFVNVKKFHAKATTENPGYATIVGDRYIVPAGTILQQSEKPTPEIPAVGICFRDVDVTDGDAWLPMTVHAVVKKDALPAEPTSQQMEQMKGIIFV